MVVTFIYTWTTVVLLKVINGKVTPMHRQSKGLLLLFIPSYVCVDVVSSVAAGDSEQEVS